MDNEKFIKEAKRRIFNYLYPQWKNNDKKFNDNDFFVAWVTKAASNNKCLIGRESSNDYFEVIHLGVGDIYVLDHYVLKKHTVI